MPNYDVLRPQPCACGCGEYAAVNQRRRRISKYRIGHNTDRTGKTHTPEAKAKIKAARARQTNVVGPGARSTPIERFVQFVAVDAMGCWPWTGARTANGYGAFGVGSTKDNTARVVRSHRFAYEYWVGPINPDLEIDHLCNNRGCVNPDHLEQVTHKENIRRAVKRR